MRKIFQDQVAVQLQELEFTAADIASGEFSDSPDEAASEIVQRVRRLRALIFPTESGTADEAAKMVAALKSRGLSQKAIGVQIGISEQTISGWKKAAPETPVSQSIFSELSSLYNSIC